MRTGRTLARRVDLIAATIPPSDPSPSFHLDRLTPAQMERVAYFRGVLTGIPPNDLMSVLTPDERMEVAELRFALTGMEPI